MVQKNSESFADKSSEYLITGTFNKNKILQMLDESGLKLSPPCTEFEELNYVKTLRTRAYIKVQDGCNNFCSYCIIPYLRGRSRSRGIQSIIDEIKSISPVEAVINGINLSAYDSDGKGLTGLINALKQVDCRIRLGSLEVRVIDREFLQALKELKNFAPHFHLSLQSGSDSVLIAMNRHYTANEYAEKVDLIREYFPDAGITTDIIAGFPTETEENFNQTLSLIERVKFSDIHPFPFSPRSGTVAYKMKDISGEIKKQRLNKLLEVKSECKKAFAQKMQGKIVDFIFEESKDGYGEGYSENYLRLYVKDYKGTNKIQKVKVLGAFKDGALGELI